MKHFKYLSNTNKSRDLQNVNIYTVICTPHVAKRKTLYKQLTILLDAEIEKVRRINYYQKGYVKLYVKTRTKLNWL